MANHVKLVNLAVPIAVKYYKINNINYQFKGGLSACTTCDVGYYLANGICSTCNSGCSSCIQILITHLFSDLFSDAKKFHLFFNNFPSEKKIIKNKIL